MEENTERDHEHKWSRVDIGLLGGSDTVCTVCGVSKWSLAERSEDADAGGRWTVVRRVTGDGSNVVVGDGLHIGPMEHDKAKAIVRDHNAALATAETARREAEQERDRLQEDIKLLTNELRESGLETGRQNARAAAAEAELAAFREKARLADEYRKSRTNMVLMGMPLSASEKSWCDRYDALTPAPEGGTA